MYVDVDIFLLFDTHKAAQKYGTIKNTKNNELKTQENIHSKLERKKTITKNYVYISVLLPVGYIHSLLNMHNCPWWASVLDLTQ